MTLEEKAAQMMCVWEQKSRLLVDKRGNFSAGKAKVSFKRRLGLGQVGRPSDAGGGKNARDMAKLTNAIQKFFISNSRHGIPVIFHEECLHGHAAVDATSFSQPIGLGATFDPELVRRLYAMTAEEARVRGTHQALTPVVDVAREPRWGRVEETFGEDPYLVSCMGVAAVRGFQGDTLFRDKKTCHCHAQAFCRTWSAGVRNQLRTGKRFRTDSARSVSATLPGGHSKSRSDECDGVL